MIREARLDDIDKLLRFGMPLIASILAPNREPDRDACRQYLDKFISGRSRTLLLAEDDGKITAFVCGAVADEIAYNERIGMISLCVINDGEHAELVRRLENWARDLGAARIIAA